MLHLDSHELDDVFDVVDIGLIVLDGERRVRAWNAWMASATGLAAASVQAQRLDELFPSTAKTRLSSAIADALSVGMSSILTHSLHPQVFALKTRSGERMVHNVAVRPMGREPTRCLIQITDVTVATERDRILRERQNARYDAVVDSAPDAILTLDTAGVIQLANPAAAREFGYLAGGLVGERIELLFGDQKAWRTAWATLRSGKSPARPVELVAMRKDGLPSYLEMSASCWETDGRSFVTAILRDTNERRAAEQALHSLNQTLEQRVAERTADRDRIWRLTTDVMLVARLDGHINATNPAWNNLLGWDEAKLTGANLIDFVVDEDKPNLEAVLRELPGTRVPAPFELRLCTSAGGSRWIAWSAVAADNLLHAVGRDVSAEREAEEALRQAEESLRQSQKMDAIGRLTGGIAHDFNNLLTGIMGSLAIVRRRVKSNQFEDVDRFMDAALASAARAASLTNRLLAFARQQPLAPRTVNVNRLIEDMDDLLRRTLGERVDLEIALGQDVGPALVDANQLENAVLNLAINARDAMPNGGRLVIKTASAFLNEGDAEFPDELEPGEYTLISVTDTGIGMSRETAAKVFDPFFTTKPIGQGTGLGLSMIYGFAKQSRGHVRITSEVQHGTTVTLYLPRHEGALADEQGDDTIETPKGSGEAVLLVEDDPGVRLLIAEVLHELGYACIEANDSQAALPILSSDTRLDLMITDIGLPGVNGRQLADIGRHHRPGLKVLFVTGYMDQAVMREGAPDPRMEIVTKPFDLDILAVKIREMIGPAQGR